MPRYVLRDGSVTDEQTWARKQGDAAYVQLAKTSLASGRWVSTLWLGIDPPGLFETAVFDAATKQPLAKETYATEAEARAGHQRLADRWA